MKVEIESRSAHSDAKQWSFQHRQGVSSGHGRYELAAHLQ